MYKYLQEFGLPVIFVLNKIDRLSKNEIFKSLTHSQEIFFGQKIIPISAKNGEGVKELERHLFDALTAK
jgi:50S ribosomal subunit-associated GTPase HflX